ncbi:unnamed protein product [Caenorhabditis bovis]|uniref:Ankyrin repeat and fibronectin type-III domain-containing protein 1 n=1 Tax=Caenorhabditis bovis TaxID=2654633 RepID=A0A8S1EM18_9PELO|nr:unnamed protein product [Caenorhabditis bovis]
MRIDKTSKKIVAQVYPTTPSIKRNSGLETANLPDNPCDFGAFSAMSQLYLLGLDDSRGKPLISVCAGAAHTLASTALLCRQQSLDEPATRALEKVASGPLLRGISLQRQNSTDPSEKRRNEESSSNIKLQKKAIKTNMISMFGALLATEQNDTEALKVVLNKNQIDVNCPITTGNYDKYATNWHLLDVAVNLNYPKTVALLQKNNATENLHMNTLEKRKKAVSEALQYTDQELHELKKNTHTKENDKHIQVLLAHQEILLRMKTNLDTVVKPNPPLFAKAETISKSRVKIYISHSEEPEDIVLKFKVEWSVYENFDKIFGEYIEPKTSTDVITVNGLESGMSLYFQVIAIGINAESDPLICSPGKLEISSWEDGESKRDSWDNRIEDIEKLTDDVEKHRQSLVWQRVFPSVENVAKRKKNGLKDLFTASSKFSKHATRGVFLASLVYTEGKVLCTVDDCLPIILIDENVTTVSKDDHHWLMKMSMCWEQVNGLMDTNPNAYSNNISLSFRTKLINAAIAMQHALGIRKIGHVHFLPITHENCIFLLTVRFIESMSQVQCLTLRWLSFDKLLRKRMPTPAIDALTRETVNILNFFESSQIPLKRGLYLCYLKLHSSINSIRVVVPDNLPSMLPFVHVRDNPHVTKEEWQWIKSTDLNEDFMATQSQVSLHSMLSTAISTLLHDLDIDNDLVPGHRLYHAEIIQPDENVSIVLILPRSDDVCTAPSGSTKHTDHSEQRRGCSSIPIPVFEMIHLCTYQSQFLTLYCRLSIFLEHFIMISQFEQRKCLLEHDLKVYRHQVEVLNDFQKRLDEIWQRARWISRVASEARDKHIIVSKNAVPLGRLMAPLFNTFDDEDYSKFGIENEVNNLALNRWHINRPRSLLSSPQESYRDIDNMYRRRKISVDGTCIPCSSNSDRSLIPDRPSIREDQKTRGIIHVTVAYDCKLSKNTKIALSISGNTTAKEVVSLVLEQVAKSTTALEQEISLPDPSDYCLVSVNGQRERRLKSETALLKIQPTWAKGNFLVRRKDDFLSNNDCGNESLV